MSYKTQDFIGNKLNEIMGDTREFKAFQLGWVYGTYDLYAYIKSSEGEDAANKAFKTYISDNGFIGDIFRDLIRVDNEPKRHSDELREKFREAKERADKQRGGSE